MIHRYSELVSACPPEASDVCIKIAGLPSDSLDALATLIEQWPQFIIGRADPPHSAPMQLRRAEGSLFIYDQADGDVRLFPAERIARRFEGLAEFCQSISDLLLLREMQKARASDIPLIFDPGQFGDTVGEALGRLRLRDPTLIRVAQELQAQLALVFNIRTTSQLVLKLSIILDSRLQLVCADYQRALIHAFWDWADANRLYMLYRLLTQKHVLMSDQAFFLYYTKLLDRMTSARRLGVDSVTEDGRLRLPLANDMPPNAVPQGWWRAMSERFSHTKVRIGAELVSMQTEPPIWQIRNR